MEVHELPLVFDCEGVSLVGMVHRPATAGRIGILTVAAGGIQYRAGCGRQLVTLARALAGQGYPVMRFDQRGMGDSVSELPGFKHLERDLYRAIEVFRDTVPEIDRVVLYGGCEAASGIMIAVPRLPLVDSLILANPWAISEGEEPVVPRGHYGRRLRDTEFWKKLFTLQYNPLDYVSQAWSWLARRLRRVPAQGKGNGEAADERPFQERMLAGFQDFDGPVLFLKSGLSFVSEEFDQLVAGSPAWQTACNRPVVRRVEVPAADQTFSTAASRRELGETVSAWLAERNAS